MVVIRASYEHSGISDARAAVGPSGTSLIPGADDTLLKDGPPSTLSQDARYPQDCLSH